MSNPRKRSFTLPPIDQIGNYAIKASAKTLEAQENSAVDLLSVAGEDNAALDQLVTNILGEEGKEILHAGVKSSRTAREKFVEKLKAVLANENTNMLWEGYDPEKAAVTMETLLGKEGIALYKAAIEEERNSREFRNAVFLRATKNHPGPKWTERLVLWIAGPSASGKSRGADAIIKKIRDENLIASDASKNEGNLVVAIDGGVEREVSQMRKLLLQVALKKGYPGIRDLHDATSLGVKGIVKKAAQKANMNLVIPNTFTRPTTLFQIGKFEKKNCKQIFGQVVAGAGEDNLFAESVKRLGNKRAWNQKYGMDNVTDDPIDINTYDLDCESKRYPARYFKKGVKGSNKAKAYYQKISKTNITLELQNDIMFVYKDKKSGEWKRCTPDYTGSAKFLSAADFKKWQEQFRANEAPDLPEWQKANQSSPSTINVHRGKPAPDSEITVKIHELRKIADDLKKGIAKLYVAIASESGKTTDTKTQELHRKRYDEYLKLTQLIYHETTKFNQLSLDPVEDEYLNNLLRQNQIIVNGINAVALQLNKPLIDFKIKGQQNNYAAINANLFALNNEIEALSFVPASNELNRILKNISSITEANINDFTIKHAELVENANVYMEHLMSDEATYANDIAVMKRIINILNNLKPDINKLGIKKSPTAQPAASVVEDRSQEAEIEFGDDEGIELREFMLPEEDTRDSKNSIPLQTFSPSRKKSLSSSDHDRPTSSPSLSSSDTESDSAAPVVTATPEPVAETKSAEPSIAALSPDPISYYGFINAVAQKQELGYPCHEEIEACFTEKNRHFIFKDKSRIEDFKILRERSILLMAQSIIDKDRNEFLSINTNEFYGNKNFTRADRTPTLVNVAKEWTSLSNFVKLNIMATSDTKQIAFAIDYWINVAYECAFNPNLKDLHGARAIHAGLNNFAVLEMITLLKKSAALPAISLNKLDQLDILFASEKNSKNQKEFLTAHESAIPYVGTMFSTREFSSNPDILWREVEELHHRQTLASAAPIADVITHPLSMHNSEVDLSNTNAVDAEMAKRLNASAPKVNGARTIKHHVKLPQQLSAVSTTEHGPKMPALAAAAPPAVEPKFSTFHYYLGDDKKFKSNIYDVITANDYFVALDPRDVAHPDVMDLYEAADELVKLDIPDSTHSLLNTDPFIRCLALAHYIVQNELGSPNNAEKWLNIFRRELTVEQTNRYLSFVTSIPEFDSRLNAQVISNEHTLDILIKLNERLKGSLPGNQFTLLSEKISATKDMATLDSLEAYIDMEPEDRQKFHRDIERLLPYLSEPEKLHVQNALHNFDINSLHEILDTYQYQNSVLANAIEKLQGDFSPEAFNLLTHAIMHAPDGNYLNAINAYINMETAERNKLDNDIETLLNSGMPASEKSALSQAFANFDINALIKARTKHQYRLNVTPLTTLYREANVDIYKYPTDIDHAPSLNDTLTIGDLHASSMKFIYFLTKHNVIDISPENYARLVDIYKRHLDYYELYNTDLLLSHAIRVKQSSIQNSLRYIEANVTKLNSVHGANFSILSLSNKEFQRNIDGEITICQNQITAYRAELTALKAQNVPPSKAIQTNIARLEATIDKLSTEKSIYTGFRNLLEEEREIRQFETQQTANARELNSPERMESLKTDFRNFDRIMAEIRVVNPTNIRLIGDELSDRGANDYFVVEIFRKLAANNCPVEALLSNHSVAFLDHYEQKNETQIDILGSDQANSSYMLLKSIADRHIDEVAFKRNVDQYYKPNIKVVSYTLNADRNGISLYSHAPIDLVVIESMAAFLGIKYNDSTPVLLAYTIDSINQKYQEYVQRGEAYKLYTIGEVTDPNEKINNPFNFAMWNRRYDILDRPDFHPKYNYALGFNHGHDPLGMTQGHLINLDNSHAKVVVSGGRRPPTHNNVGEHTMTRTVGSQLTLEERQNCDKTISPVNFVRLEANAQMFAKMANNILADNPTKAELESLAATQVELKNRLAKFEYQEKGRTPVSAALAQLINIEIPQFKAPAPPAAKMDFLNGLKAIDSTLSGIDAILADMLSSLQNKAAPKASVADLGMFQHNDRDSVAPAPVHARPHAVPPKQVK